MFDHPWHHWLKRMAKAFQANFRAMQGSPRRHRPWMESLEDRTVPTTVNLTPTGDNTLYLDPTGHLSNGAGQHFYVGDSNQSASLNIRRGAIKFDLSSVPAGSTITAVTLKLTMSKTNNGAQAIALHRTLQSWGEGTSNAATGGTGSGEGDGIQATTNDVTWLNTFFSNQTWATPGGSFVAAASASTSVGGVGTYQWTGMTADVQAWVNNSATNFGWIMTGNEATQPTAKQFDTKENVTAANRPVLTVTFTAPPPDLTISKSHTGNFRQGNSADTYTLTVNNIGTGPTSGAVTVTDTLPTGLTPTAADTGTINGWAVSFTNQIITATRSNALAAGTSFPALTITVAVANNAPASVTNTATVAGGGESNTANDSASDPTTITQAADLTVSKSHTGNFRQGHAADTYTLIVNNIGAGPTVGAVTVTDTLPSGLAPTAADNATINGWAVTFTNQTITATRSDVLAAGGSYLPLTITVAVSNTAPASVTNTATVAGGGELNAANDSANDPTTIDPGAPQPQVVSVTVNGDIASLAGAQRSRVVSLQVVFNEPVQLDLNAFALALHTSGVIFNGVAGPFGSLPTNLVRSTTDDITWVVKFQGNTDPLPPDFPVPADGLNSIQDGVYDFAIDATQVHPLGFTGIVGAANSTTVFDRLYGDVTGEDPVVGIVHTTTINTTDNLDFRTSFNSLSGVVGTQYQTYFDFDGDRQVNTADNLQFRARFNQPLTWSV